MLFYLFQTQVDNIYKFGTTKYDLSIQRLKQYCGLNSPKKIITIYSVVNGFDEESSFKSFLQEYGVKIIFGNDFFEYNEDIESLLMNYKVNCNDKDKSDLPDIEEPTDVFAEFLKHLTDNNNNVSFKYIYAQNFFDTFLKWCKQENIVSGFTSTKFGRKIKTYDGISKEHKRLGTQYCLNFKKLAEGLNKNQ